MGSLDIRAARIDNLNDYTAFYHAMLGIGCLSFYTFGWEILDQLKELAFQEATAHLYWSVHYGYLDQEGLLFTAQKCQENFV